MLGRLTELSPIFLLTTFTTFQLIPSVHFQESIPKPEPKMSLKFNLIVAACENNLGIGLKNDLPWKLKKEMGYFHRMTTSVDSPGQKNLVLMGKNTWNSIPESRRPLKDRLNVVLTSKPSELITPEGVLKYSNWDETVTDLSTQEKRESFENIWIVGGSSVYKAAMESPYCHRIYITKVLKWFDCDVFFPKFDHLNFTLITDPRVPQEEQEENGIPYRFEVYEKNVQ